MGWDMKIHVVEHRHLKSLPNVSSKATQKINEKGHMVISLSFIFALYRVRFREYIDGNMWFGQKSWTDVKQCAYFDDSHECIQNKLEFFLEIGGFTRSFPIVIDKIKRVSSDLKINQLLLKLVLSVRLSEWNIMLFIKEMLMIFNFNDYGNVAIYAVIAIRKRLCATKFTWKRFAMTAFYTPFILRCLKPSSSSYIYLYVSLGGIVLCGKASILE